MSVRRYPLIRSMSDFEPMPEIEFKLTYENHVKPALERLIQGMDEIRQRHALDPDKPVSRSEAERDGWGNE
jgi:hypothetical protein